MHPQAPSIGKTYGNGYVVRRPQSTDALGHTLRGVFVDTPMPDDLVRLLHRLNHVAH